MSAKATFWAWEQQIEHAPSKLVLLCLADHCGEGGACWPAVSRIMVLTGLSESTVRNCIIKLEASGYLAKKPRLRDNGSCSSNELTVSVGAIICPTKTFGTPPAIEGGYPPGDTPPPSVAYTTPPPPRTPPEPTILNLPFEKNGDGAPDSPAEPQKKRKANPHFDVLVEVCGFSKADVLPVAARIAKASAALRTFEIDEIRRRAAVHKAIFHYKPLTPWSIADNWPLLVNGPAPKIHQEDKILQLRRKIRDSRAFVGGPFYVTCHSELEAMQLKTWKQDLLAISSSEDFSLLKE